MKKPLFKTIISYFILWRVLLFGVALLSTFIITSFGNRFPYYKELLIPTGLPSWVWGFGNFDGVYYIKIAKVGYIDQYTQAFFPLYPLIIKLFTIDNLFFTTALILSNVFFIASLLMLYKLYKLDHSSQISFYSIILLLSFPTAFYFGSVYSESLFLLLSISSLYFIRKNNFLIGGVLASLASTTRIFGLLLVPVLLIEMYKAFSKKEINLKNWQFVKSLVGVIVAPVGLLLYMLYLKVNFDNPLYFLTAQPAFGAGRTDAPFVLLPQVIFRYLKIFLTVKIVSLPFLNAAMELFLTLTPLILLGFLFKKIRFSYFIFTLGILMIPTLTGTLSSMPRYALMSFLIFPYLVLYSKKYYPLLTTFLIFLQVVLLCLFIRGYWVA